MNEARLAVRTDGDRVHLALTGEIDLSNADEIQAQIASGIPNDVKVVELDVSDVAYLDSAGLHVIYALISQLRRLQVELRIFAATRTAARHALEVSGMASLAEIQQPSAR